jgi:8-oxo-dGTP diphosphatase
MSGGRVLVQRRAPRALHGAGCLELPGGKIERGESPAAALQRELVEEWGPEASALEVGGVVDVVHHVYDSPGPEVLLIVMHVDGHAWSTGPWSDRVELEPGTKLECHVAGELPLGDFLEADRPLIGAIRAHRIRDPRSPLQG